MNVSKWDLMKLSQAFDGDFDPSDFTQEELDELLGLTENCGTIEEVREKYFEFYDDVKDRTLHKHKWSD